MNAEFFRVEPVLTNGDITLRQVIYSLDRVTAFPMPQELLNLQAEFATFMEAMSGLRAKYLSSLGSRVTGAVLSNRPCWRSRFSGKRRHPMAGQAEAPRRVSCPSCGGWSILVSLWRGRAMYSCTRCVREHTVWYRPRKWRKRYVKNR